MILLLLLLLRVKSLLRGSTQKVFEWSFEPMRPHLGGLIPTILNLLLSLFYDLQGGMSSACYILPCSSFFSFVPSSSFPLMSLHSCPMLYLWLFGFPLEILFLTLQTCPYEYHFAGVLPRSPRQQVSYFDPHFFSLGFC